MAKCILDLRDLFNNDPRYLFQDAETFIVDSASALEFFVKSAITPGPTGIPISSVIVTDKDLYPTLPNNEYIWDYITEWRDSLIGKNTAGNTIIKERDRAPLGTFLDKLVLNQGNPPDANGRINLSPVGGDPCKRGFYGLVVDKLEVRQPIYEICYVPRDPFKLQPGFVRAKLIGYNKYMEYKNLRGPEIISDEIANRSGLGISIVDDEVACPPIIDGEFSATDYDFGEVDQGSKNPGRIQLYNNGKVGIRVTDISPKDHPNFKIGEFTQGLGWSPFKKSPMELPFEMPPDPRNYLEFFVNYDANNEYDKDHEGIFTYTVETVGIKSVPVTQTKLITKLTGRTRKIEVVCSDVNWGLVDSDSLLNEKTIQIENKSSKSVYLEEYKLITDNPNNFNRISIPPTYLTNPIEIKPNEIYKFTINYDGLDVYDIEHKGTIEYKFYYIDSTGLRRNVLGSKLVSYLKAQTETNLVDVFDPQLEEDDNGVYTFKTLSVIRDRTVRITKHRTYPLWKCRKERLTDFYTGSNGQKTDKYYLPVYDKPVSLYDSYHEFDISYGHINGSGSSYIQDGVDLFPSKVMYRKYLVEAHGNTTGSTGTPTKFHFKNGINGNSVYFIQTHRDQFKDMVDPGNFELCLVPLSSSTNQLYNTGSNFSVDQSSRSLFTLIDDSGDSKQDRTERSGLDTFYYLVSGSRRDGVYGEPEDDAWGLVFPKMGLFVLDANVLDKSCSFNTVTASIDGDNPMKLFLSLSGSATTSVSRSVSQSFFARSAERALVETYFCRALPEEFNSSNNPTYTGTSLNSFRYSYFIRDPHTFITSIGLYNKRNELLAVGKLKRPLLKNDRTQYTFQVRVRIM